MPRHPPLQIGRGGDDGQKVGRLRGLTGGVRQNEVSLLADRGPPGRIVGQYAGAFCGSPSSASDTVGSAQPYRRMSPHIVAR